MPLYTFNCEKCGYSVRRILSPDVASIVCICGDELERDLPSSLSSNVTEMRDKYRGVQLDKNHDKNMEKRYKKHHDKYDIAEKIDKYGIDEARRLGWTKKR